MSVAAVGSFVFGKKVLFGFEWRVRRTSTAAIGAGIDEHVHVRDLQRIAPIKPPASLSGAQLWVGVSHVRALVREAMPCAVAEQFVADFESKWPKALFVPVAAADALADDKDQVELVPLLQLLHSGSLAGQIHDIGFGSAVTCLLPRASAMLASSPSVVLPSFSEVLAATGVSTAAAAAATTATTSTASSTVMGNPVPPSNLPRRGRPPKRPLAVPPMSSMTTTTLLSSTVAQTMQQSDSVRMPPPPPRPVAKPKSRNDADEEFEPPESPVKRPRLPRVPPQVGPDVMPETYDDRVDMRVIELLVQQKLRGSQGSWTPLPDEFSRRILRVTSGKGKNLRLYFKSHIGKLCGEHLLWPSAQLTLQERCVRSGTAPIEPHSRNGRRLLDAARRFTFPNTPPRTDHLDDFVWHDCSAELFELETTRAPILMAGHVGAEGVRELCVKLLCVNRVVRFVVKIPSVGSEKSFYGASAPFIVHNNGKNGVLGLVKPVAVIPAPPPGQPNAAILEMLSNVASVAASSHDAEGRGRTTTKAMFSVPELESGLAQLAAASATQGVRVDIEMVETTKFTSSDLQLQRRGSVEHAAALFVRRGSMELSARRGSVSEFTDEHIPLKALGADDTQAVITKRRRTSVDIEWHVGPNQGNGAANSNLNINNIMN